MNNIFKKAPVFVLAGALVVNLLSACGGNDEQKAEKEEKKAAKEKKKAEEKKPAASTKPSTKP